jgi:transcriptional regulator with PAS, ATPase and Fis domain
VLVDYHWPGNIRELDNLVKQMFITSRGESRITGKALAGMLERLNNGKSDKESSLIQKRKKYEKEQIEKALAEAKGVKSQAARILGIDESLLRYKIKTLGITSPPRSNGSDQG